MRSKCASGNLVPVTVFKVQTSRGLTSVYDSRLIIAASMEEALYIADKFLEDNEEVTAIVEQKGLNLYDYDC